jgi:hypothetical protein
MTMSIKVDGGSFRDPSGTVFYADGQVYRQVNHAYREDYDCLMESGLYEKLAKNRCVVRHEEVTGFKIDDKVAYRVIKPERVLISYPYEWVFDMYKDAALLTLKIQKLAIEHGMTLKDASAYNVQFHEGKPILIDTLSFTKYVEGEPWIAYRQFCQHFLAPLALMSITDFRLSQLMRVYIDGVPLDLATKLLPAKVKFNIGLYAHLFMHAKSQKKFESVAEGKAKMSRINLLGLVDSLEGLVGKMSLNETDTEWGDYYNNTNYTDVSLGDKYNAVKQCVQLVKPELVWDFGGNTGYFSRVASDQGIRTVCFDVDHNAVSENYNQVKVKDEKYMLPLIMDLKNPSPDMGWANSERGSLAARELPGMIICLALIHHLVISNNVPFVKVAEYLAGLSEHLVIEYVDKEDSQVQRLLRTREDIFKDYSVESFKADFGRYYAVEWEYPVPHSKRIIFLMKRLSV